MQVDWGEFRKSPKDRLCAFVVDGPASRISRAVISAPLPGSFRCWSASCPRAKALLLHRVRLTAAAGARRLVGLAVRSAHATLLQAREALGERRPLIEVPAQEVAVDEREDGIYTLVLAILFLWDCHRLSGRGDTYFYLSHDEFGA